MARYSRILEGLRVGRLAQRGYADCGNGVYPAVAN